MKLQVKDILIDAMGLINAIDVDETPTLSEMNLALRTANVMLDNWSLNRILLQSTVSESFPVIAYKSIYTIGSPTGSTPDIVTAKPINIISAFLRDLNNVDTMLSIRDKKDLDAYGDKQISSARPEVLIYDPGIAQQTNNVGTIELYPIPDSSSPYTIFISSDKYLTELVNLTDVITFAPGYYEAMIYNLAARLYRHFHESSTTLPPDIMLIASTSLKSIYKVSSETFKYASDFPVRGNRYNIYIDQ